MPRRGTSLTEVLVASMIVAAIISATAQYASVLHQSRNAAEQRLVATQEVQALAELLSAMKFADLTNASVGKLELSETASARLPGGQLQIHLQDDSGDPQAGADESNSADGAKRIQIEIRWQDRAGQTAAPARLTLWRYDVGNPQ